MESATDETYVVVAGSVVVVHVFLGRIVVHEEVMVYVTPGIDSRMTHRQRRHRTLAKKYWPARFSKSCIGLAMAFSMLCKQSHGS